MRAIKLDCDGEIDYFDPRRLRFDSKEPMDCEHFPFMEHGDFETAFRMAKIIAQHLRNRQGCIVIERI